MIIRTHWGDFTLDGFEKINPYTYSWLKEFIEVFPIKPDVVAVNPLGTDHPVEVFFRGKEVAPETLQEICNATCRVARANLYREGQGYLLVVFPEWFPLVPEVLRNCLEPLIP